MEKKKRNIIILVILCILLVVIGIFVCIDVFSPNNVEIPVIDNKYDNIIDNYNQSDKPEENNISNNVMEYSNEHNKDEVENNVNDNLSGEVYDNNQNVYTEQDVVRYFEDMEYEINSSSSFKDKFKEYFITIVDFIFYEKEIKGYTFNGLTSIAKAKIIAVALKIDIKIEEYVPGYKETISSTTGKLYTDIKEKLVTSYMDISTAVCKDNKDDCDKVKDIFSDIKDYCKIGWDFIKGLFKSGAVRIKDWYEIYSGK